MVGQLDDRRQGEARELCVPGVKHIASPDIHTQVAEYFGEAPANSKACALTVRVSAASNRAERPGVSGARAGTGRRRERSVPRRPHRREVQGLHDWTKAWTEIKGSAALRRRRDCGRPARRDGLGGHGRSTAAGIIAWSSRPLCSVRDLRARPRRAGRPRSPAVDGAADRGRPAPSTACFAWGLLLAGPPGWLGHCLLGSLVDPVRERVLERDAFTGPVIHQFTLQNFVEILTNPSLPRQ